MEGRTCHLRRRECPGAAGIGSTTCKTKESCNTTIMIGKRRQDLQAAVHCCSWSACDGQWTLIGLGARAVSMEGRTCHLRRRECPGAAGIGSTTCKTKESCNTIIMIGKRRQDLQVAVDCCCSWSACDGQWTLIGLGARAVSMEGMACHLRRRAWPRAAGIGSATCKAEELQHIYYDREASSGFAGCGALLFMVGMRWRVDSDWTRGQCRVNGRDGVPLETAGVAGSSRHQPGHLQDRRELQHIYCDREASSGFAGCGALLFMVGLRWLLRLARAGRPGRAGWRVVGRAAVVFG